VLPSSTWGHQTTESTPAELHDKTAERGGGCGRGDDGERRRARSGEAGERDRVGERAGGVGGASGGGDRGGEEAQALSPRSGDAGEAGPAGTGALCLARSEEQEEGGERQERGSGPAVVGRRPAGPVSAALGPGAGGFSFPFL